MLFIIYLFIIPRYNKIQEVQSVSAHKCYVQLICLFMFSFQNMEQYLKSGSIPRYKFDPCHRFDQLSASLLLCVTDFDYLFS